MSLSRNDMERIVRDYMDACTRGIADDIEAYFEPDGVHYFPPGMYEGPFRGARTIAERWQKAVETGGSSWTVDAIAIDELEQSAVCEWTHFKTSQSIILRGTEWYEFSERGLITEIRAYYASPQDPSLRTLELGGFDYTGRGYPLTPEGTDK